MIPTAAATQGNRDHAFPQGVFLRDLGLLNALQEGNDLGTS